MPLLIRVTTVPLSLHVLLRNQLKYMQEHGLEVIMVSADGKERETVVANEQCRHIIIPMTRKITPVRDIVAFYKLTRLLRKLKPDIVHSHTPKAGLIAMLASRFAGVRIRIHTIAGLRFMTSSGVKRWILIRMEKLTALFATHVWPNSFSLMQYVKEKKLVNDAKLEVIGGGSSNGIDLSRFSKEKLEVGRLRKIKEQVRFDSHLIYLLCVGRIVKDKGVEELVKAFVELYETNSKVRLLLVGGYEDELDPVSDEIKAIIHNHPGVIMAGWSEEVEYFMAFANMLVHPSHREGFPNVLLQAGAMQCPVICSKIPGNTDVIEHQNTGLVFMAKNKDSLLCTIKEAIENPAGMEQYAKALRNKVEKFYDQPVVHRMIYERYKELLKLKGIRH